TTSSSTTGSSSTTTSDASATGSSLNAVTPFNGGVQGEVNRLVLFVAHVPTPMKTDGDSEVVQMSGPDIRRVCYWLAGDHGLARQEVNRPTADDESTQLPPDVPDEENLVIAPEVVTLEFHYFDGTNWVDSWDGTSI